MTRHQKSSLYTVGCNVFIADGLFDVVHSSVAFFLPILVLLAWAGWWLRERDAKKRYQRRIQEQVRDETDPRWRDQARATDPRAR